MDEKKTGYLRVTVRVQSAGTDPTIPIFGIEIEECGPGDSVKGCWHETYGTLELANCFLRGIQATANLADLPIVQEIISPSTLFRYGDIRNIETVEGRKMALAEEHVPF